jgi:hypothetical protein
LGFGPDPKENACPNKSLEAFYFIPEPDKNLCAGAFGPDAFAWFGMTMRHGATASFLTGRKSATRGARATANRSPQNELKT